MDTHIPKMMEKVDSFKQNGHSLVFLLDFLLSTSLKKKSGWNGYQLLPFVTWIFFPKNGRHVFSHEKVSIQKVQTRSLGFEEPGF